jgi:surface antigen
MKTRIITSFISTVLTIGLISGCASGPQEQSGTVAGGIVGAAVGSTIGKGDGRIAAIILGTLAGSAIGANIGRHMDVQDRVRTAEIMEYNRTGQPSGWKNPDSGNVYTVTPTRTYERAEAPCREFTMNANIGGKVERIYGTACRQADGSWKVVQ